MTIPKITDAQLNDAIFDGVNTIFRRIQETLGQDAGDNAAMWFQGDEEYELNATLRDVFSRYAEYERKAMEEEAQPVPKWKVGDRVVLMRDEERFDHFVMPAGLIGVVTLVEVDTCHIRMEQPVEGAEHWDNELIIGRDDLYHMDQAELDAMFTVIGTDHEQVALAALSNCARVLAAISDSEGHESPDVKYAVNRASEVLKAADDRPKSSYTVWVREVLHRSFWIDANHREEVEELFQDFAAFEQRCDLVDEEVHERDIVNITQEDH
jgi:hypothetical protein